MGFGHPPVNLTKSAREYPRRVSTGTHRGPGTLCTPYTVLYTTP